MSLLLLFFFLDVDRSLQMHSSLIRRLSQERELEVSMDFDFFFLFSPIEAFS
jgi:hypothetical protein